MVNLTHGGWRNDYLYHPAKSVWFVVSLSSLHGSDALNHPLKEPNSLHWLPWESCLRCLVVQSDYANLPILLLHLSPTHTYTSSSPLRAFREDAVMENSRLMLHRAHRTPQCLLLHLPVIATERQYSLITERKVSSPRDMKWIKTMFGAEYLRYPSLLPFQSCAWKSRTQSWIL